MKDFNNVKNAKMKILIATGVYPPAIGGPAQYALHLEEEFSKQGHGVSVVTYGIERYLPIGIRHFVFFIRTLFHMKRVSFVLMLDTFSTGLPALFAARLFGKKAIVRIGGDFLWESYVNRTGERVHLSEFYDRKISFSLKEKLIKRLIVYVLQKVDAIVFTTTWQRELFSKVYHLRGEKLHIVENFYGTKQQSTQPQEKNFVWAARSIPLKNEKLLRDAFEKARAIDPDLILEGGTYAYAELLERIKGCYAVILPSFSEVSPNFIIDALQFDKPFIVTKDTGLYEKLEHIGLFVDPFDTKDLTDKILLLGDEKVRELYKKKVEQFDFTHSWSEIGNAFVSIYSKL